jgi:zinc/manganese transport system ATP-binding protein
MSGFTQPAITIRGATLRFGKRALFTKLDLDVQPGEFIAVLGPNGSGKSSLIKTVLGLTAPNAGTVHVLGEKPQAVRSAIGYIPQQKAFDRDTPMSGRDLVKLGVSGTRWFLRPTSVAENARLSAAVKEVGATQFAHKPLGTLSGGEQQRLRIAQALVGKPQVLLCDEPLLSLDLASQQAIAALIDNQRKKGTAVLFVTHEINPILPLVDRILYLAGGKWVVGTPAEVLTSATLTALYNAPVEVLRVHGRIVVVGGGEHMATEPQDTHHHQEHHHA